MTAEQANMRDLLSVIRAESLEIPGLALTKPQFRRLWDLDVNTCETVLDALVAARFLYRDQRDAYVLAGGYAGS